MSKSAIDWWYSGGLREVGRWEFPPRPKRKTPQRAGRVTVLLVSFLCDAANERDGGTFWWSQPALAEALGVSRGEVARELRNLEQIGAITRVGERAGDHGGRPIPVYVLTCVPKFAAGWQSVSSRLAARWSPLGDIANAGNPSAVTEISESVCREPEPKPEPAAKSPQIAAVPPQQAAKAGGEGLEKHSADTQLQALTSQAMADDAARYGQLNLAAKQSKRRHQLTQVLADYLSRFPAVDHAMLVTHAVDQVHGKGDPYALEGMQQRAEERAAHQTEVSRWHSLTPEQQQAEREQRKAEKAEQDKHDAEERRRADEAMRRLFPNGVTIGRPMPADDDLANF